MPDETINVIFKFFKIHRSREFSGSLKSILTEQLGRPQEERLVEKVNGVDRVLLDKTANYNGYSAWLFASKRMRGLPTKIDAQGVKRSLDLDDDEGLGETMAIACDPTCTVAAIQSNQHAMTEKALAKMINKFSPEAHINFIPMLKVDALERLSRSNSMRKLRVKVAGEGSFNHLREYGLSDAELLRFQSFLQAPTVDICWGMGRERSGELSGYFSRLLKALVNYKDAVPTHNLKALEAVLQYEENGARITDTVDFLSERLIYFAPISLNAQREIDEDELLSASYQALIEKNDEISRYLRNENEQNL